MARVPVVAAGGIVLRRQQPPLVAVVRLRKRDEWVLPKGKLDDGETPRAAAKREVLEETGHNVTVHEFLGTLVYDSGGRSKVVHYWHMEAAGEQAYKLMDDVRAVDWLPLNAAVERLSRPHEQVFLENVGPQALAAYARRQKAKAPASRKRRDAPAIAPEPVPAERVPEPALVEPLPEPQLVEPQLAEPVLEPMRDEPIRPSQRQDLVSAPVVPSESPLIAHELIIVEPPASVAEAEECESPVETEAPIASPAASNGGISDASTASDRQRRSLAQKVRDWLSRAA
jgi:8-oxo-dGTP diphosphatase